MSRSSGYKHTEETKQKIAQKNRGRKRTREQRQRISDSLKGRKLSEEHKRNVSKARKGMKLSDKHRINMSKSLRSDSSALVAFDPATRGITRAQKRQIHERDEYMCQLCGKAFGGWHRNLYIHHIDENPFNNDSKNLISLCSFCHRAYHKFLPERRPILIVYINGK